MRGQVNTIRWGLEDLEACWQQGHVKKRGMSMREEGFLGSQAEKGMPQYAQHSWGMASSSWTGHHLPPTQTTLQE